MEHVLFVIIYAATLNTHKLFGLVSSAAYLMTTTKGLCTDITRHRAARKYVYTIDLKSALVMTKFFLLNMTFQTLPEIQVYCKISRPSFWAKMNSKVQLRAVFKSLVILIMSLQKYNKRECSKTYSLRRNHLMNIYLFIILFINSVLCVYVCASDRYELYY